MKPAIVNVGDLNRCAEGERVTPERLEALGLIRSAASKVKLLGDGKLNIRVKVCVHNASTSAKTKIEKAGGTLELLTAESQKPPQPTPALAKGGPGKYNKE